MISFVPPRETLHPSRDREGADVRHSNASPADTEKEHRASACVPVREQWKKLGRIFVAPGGESWMKSHSALPAAHDLGHGRFRVYFCSRDDQSRSQIGRFELDLSDPARVTSVSDAPLVRIGPLGAYDDSGVTTGCLVEHRGTQYLYFTGWSLGQTVPFYYAIGLAVSEDAGRTFRKVSRAPIMGRSEVDPFLIASPCVMIDDGAWRMWYVSGVKWEIENGRPRHYYHIKYAESADGIDWTPTGRVCIDFASPAEFAIARPTVIKQAGLYRMWFPCRGKAYRIGYAESHDGLHWHRCDTAAGIDVSPGGAAGATGQTADDDWDTDMLCYPWVFTHGGRLHMLFNGNGYGQSGVGLAKAQPA